ncbi:MAG: Do family serine endopeptidase, partial [Acidobacteriota bacterium]
MVLAGGTALAPPSFAEPDIDDSRAVTVPWNGEANLSLPSFSTLAEAVSPAVVSVDVEMIEEATSRRRDPFEFFFGPRGRQQQGEEEPQRRRRDSSGSGFVISEDGLIVTNHHVIEDATGVTIQIEGREYNAEVIGDDPATDIALLKIDPEEPLDYLALGNSDTVRPGDWIMVIGSPLNLDNSVSVGVVSAKGRSINITPDRALENFIQTDAAINFGNSGGPLVDLNGQVIGIATAINYGAENIGFAVPVNILKSILPQLRERGSVQRGYLGIEIRDVDYEIAEAFDLPDAAGVLVGKVTPDGPSEAAGLQHGDIILELDGRKVDTTRGVIDYVSSRAPGTKVDVELFRSGDRLRRTIELGERPGNGAPQVVDEREPSSGIEWLGLTYTDIGAQARQSLEIPSNLNGVLVRGVAPDSPLYEEGVIPNDVITEINGQSIGSVADFEQAIKGVESGKVARLYVLRFDPRAPDGQSFFAFVRVP